MSSSRSSAAASKKTLSKDDLRRLMRKEISVSGSAAGGADAGSGAPGNTKTAARVSHPLAKYNTLGQLSCAVCGCAVKSVILWQTHVLSRSHRASVEASASARSQKRSARDTAAVLAAKQARHAADSGPGHGKDVADLGLGYASSDEDGDEGDAAAGTSSTASGGSALPADFFDAGKPAVSATTAAVAKNLPNLRRRVKEKAAAAAAAPAAVAAADDAASSDLPEGFFDDPYLDAKARHVPFKDKLDEEYAVFERTMKEEVDVSEQIVEEEDEMLIADRDLHEIDDQMRRWTTIQSLEKKVDELNQQQLLLQNKKQLKATLDSDDEDEDPDSLLMHWRKKKS